MTPEEKLIAIRKICFSIDQMIEADRTKWRGSLQWVTVQIMEAAKFGEGYPGQEVFPICVDVGDLAPEESRDVVFEWKGPFKEGNHAPEPTEVP